MEDFYLSDLNINLREVSIEDKIFKQWNSHPSLKERSSLRRGEEAETGLTPM